MNKIDIDLRNAFRSGNITNHDTMMLFYETKYWDQICALMTAEMQLCLIVSKIEDNMDLEHKNKRSHLKLVINE